MTFHSSALSALRNEALQPVVVGSGVKSVVTANTDHIVRLSQDRELRRAYANAWRRTIDGTPVYLYARMQAQNVQKVTGADLVPALLEKLNPDSTRLFFVVADAAIASGIEDWATRTGFSPADFRIAVPPMGFDTNLAYQAQLAGDVRDHKTTHLFVGVGCPRSEVWVERFRDKLGDLYAFSVGAALAFHVGTLQRAPAPIRSLGLEWFWRLMQEPRRLSKRYFMRSWSFAYIVMLDVWLRVRNLGGYNLHIQDNY